MQDLKARRAEVTARRTSLEHEMVRLDDQQRLLEQVALNTASLAEYCQRVREALHRFTAEEKRLALDALNITAVWHHGTPLKFEGVFRSILPLMQLGARAPGSRPC